MSPRLRRFTGHLVLGVFFATFVASLSAGHLAGQDDEFCVVSERGNSPATLAPKTTTDAPGHCGVCHWVRAVAGAALYGPSSTLAFVIEQRPDTAFVDSGLRDPLFSVSSSRAPPSPSLS